MPLFITQGRYSREAISGMIAKPEDRSATAAKLIEAAGGKMLAYYVTFGEYDWLIVADLPEREARGRLHRQSRVDRRRHRYQDRGRR